MPSHLREKMLDEQFSMPAGVTDADVTGNDWADELAGKASTYAELPLNVTTPIIYYKNLAMRIQRRLVAVLCALPNRSKHTHFPRVPIPFDSIEDLCNNSKHLIFECGNFLACSRCKASKHRNSQGIKHWLKGQCYAIGTASDRPIPLQQEFIQIGKLNIHNSHKTYKFKDTYFCNRCGCFARVKIRHLAQQCEAPTEAGLKFLFNIQKGIVPKTGYLYSRFSSIESTTLNNIQTSVDAIAIAIPSTSSARSIISSPVATHSASPSPFSIPGSD